MSRVAPLALVLGMGVVPVAGCAFNDITVSAPRSFRIARGAGRGAGREVVVGEAFHDGRPETHRCGIKKNGYNAESANVFCAMPPHKMLADMLAIELSAAGFQVARDPGRAAPSAVVISGVLLQAFVEAKHDFVVAHNETDLGLKLIAKSMDGLWAERTFYVKGVDPFLFDVDGSAERSFHSGVRQMLTTTVAAIANLVETLPVASAEVQP
jgi:hypothetical protein